MKSLVIGYGNSLRSDDGIGIRVAEIVSSWQLPEINSLALAQLTPEIAADLSKVDLVIFVDACSTTDTNTVKLSNLKPANQTQIRSHLSNPQALLSLTQTLYGKCPQAWALLVPGVNFQIGDRLSAVAETGIDRALIQIKNLVTENSCTKSV